MRHVLLRLNSYMCLFDDTEFGKKDWRVQTRIGLTKSEINNAFSQLTKIAKDHVAPMHNPFPPLLPSGR